MFRQYRAWVMLMLLVMVSGAYADAAPRTVRLLTVGNSFADNALTYLPKIAEAGGDKLIYAKANVGGCSMERHWEFVQAYETDHDGKIGKPYAGHHDSLAEMLARDHWDVVTIQQVSWISHDPATYRPFARQLADYIHQHAPDAKIWMHQTWAYRVDDPRFSPDSKDAGPHSQRQMHEQVRAAYHQIAAELGVGIIPSGDAMQIAHTDATWGYKPDMDFDFAHAQPPALPDQTHSLHAGWYWKKDKDAAQKLKMDGHHANKAGCYLIGCVWYEVLFDRDVRDNGFVPEGLDADFAKFLRQAAHEAVANQ